jgi:uncharacterized membrane protein YbhN (UPF0104 family)
MARRWLTVAVKAAITILLIAWLVHRIEIGPAIGRLAAIDVGWTIAALVAMTVQLLLAGWRWALIGAAIDGPPRRGSIVRLTFVGQFFNQTLPSAIGGDAVRAWMAAREGLPAGKAVSGVVADRVVGLVVLLLISAATLPLFVVRVPDHVARLGVFATVLGSLAALALFCIFAKPVGAKLQTIRVARPFANLALDLRHVLVGARQSLAIIGLRLHGDVSAGRAADHAADLDRRLGGARGGDGRGLRLCRRRCAACAGAVGGLRPGADRDRPAGRRVVVQERRAG